MESTDPPSGDDKDDVPVNESIRVTRSQNRMESTASETMTEAADGQEINNSDPQDTDMVEKLQEVSMVAESKSKRGKFSFDKLYSLYFSVS
jgi:hypothetical protein